MFLGKDHDKISEKTILDLTVHINVTWHLFVAYFTSSPFEGTATAQHGISWTLSNSLLN